MPKLTTATIISAHRYQQQDQSICDWLQSQQSYLKRFLLSMPKRVAFVHVFHVFHYFRTQTCACILPSSIKMSIPIFASDFELCNKHLIRIDFCPQANYLCCLLRIGTEKSGSVLLLRIGHTLNLNSLALLLQPWLYSSVLPACCQQLLKLP